MSSDGLIPACAGKTLFNQADIDRPEAHPRVCGENGKQLAADFATHGSSPRVRGKHRYQKQHLPLHGLIPACAGKTGVPVRWTGPIGAHPRVCGENSYAKPGKASQQGSSPRVRGKLWAQARGAFPVRLIPACAGKTCTLCQVGARGWAHPRVCGENSCQKCVTIAANGSSPRVRGKRALVAAGTFVSGLIPACAGKTDGTSFQTFTVTAHPRVCGENLVEVCSNTVPLGSSPRVRGKLIRTIVCSCHFGLIPACAGKTLLSCVRHWA